MVIKFQFLKPDQIILSTTMDIVKQEYVEVDEKDEPMVNEEDFIKTEVHYEDIKEEPQEAKYVVSNINQERNKT